MRAGDFLFLPWHHTIRYFCRSSSSFLVDGIHLVPHHPQHPLQRSPQRRDAVLRDLEGVIPSSFVPHSRFDRLCQYIIDSFIATRPTQRSARQLAELFLLEFRQTVRGRKQPHMPAPLAVVVQHLTQHLPEPHTVGELAALAQCSEATLTRLFRAHFDLSPTRWIVHERMKQAALLLATTSLRVQEIGRRVGVDDPYYFSKLFRKIHRQTPLQYRQQQSIV